MTHIIVELTDETTEETHIAIEGGCNYAVARIGDDGVARLVDWSYRSIEEAQAAWPELVAGKPTLEAV